MALYAIVVNGSVDRFVEAASPPAGSLPVVEEHPMLAADEEEVGPDYRIEATQVVAVWQAVKINEAEPNRLRAAIVSLLGRPRIVSADVAVTIGSIAAAAFTDKTFTVPGLLTTDLLLSAYFPAGLNPATISMTPLRISAADTLICRFAKISTGAVTPPTPQTLRVVVAR